MKPDFNKILEVFNNLDDRLRYGIFGGVVLLVLLLDVFFLALPQMGSIANINTQIQKMSDDTQRVTVDKQRINLLRKNLQQARNKLNALSVKVRPIQEVPVILGNISTIAKESGVKIDQLTPEYNQLETLNEADEGKYYALPVVVKAHSGYHNFGRFLNKAENQDLSFMMKDFIIQNEGNNPNIHSFSMTLKIILVDRTAPAKSL